MFLVLRLVAAVSSWRISSFGINAVCASWSYPRYPRWIRYVRTSSLLRYLLCHFGKLKCLFWPKRRRAFRSAQFLIRRSSGWWRAELLYRRQFPTSSFEIFFEAWHLQLSVCYTRIHGLEDSCHTTFVLYLSRIRTSHSLVMIMNFWSQELLILESASGREWTLSGNSPG